MVIRLSKTLLVAAMAFHCLLVAFGNITDYYTNHDLVERALLMNEVFPESTIMYRAISSPILHHAAYLTIISLEMLTTYFCLLGAWQLFRVRNAAPPIFNHAKKWSVVGLTLGIITWQVLFRSVGGEWFGMWMSPVLNGALTSAFHISIILLATLIYVTARDD
jgi:predicted small integral membrane protein